MRPRPVLITGAGGFIGSAFVPAVLDAGLDVVAVDRDPSRLEQFTPRADPSRMRSVQMDITDADGIARVVAAARPSAIVHLAALHFIPACESEPRRTVETNIGGLINVLAAADRGGTEFVLFASSADVYTVSAGPLAENDPARPSTVYGATKLLGERLVAEWAGRRSGRRATSLRIFNVYGPADGNPHVVPEILESLLAGREIRVGNTDARRDFVHVDDLAELLRDVLLSADPPSLVNAGTGLATSVAEILAILEKVVDHPFAWSSDPAKFRSVERPSLQADTDRLRAAFPGFRPRSIQDGLADILTVLGVPVGAARTAAQ